MTPGRVQGLWGKMPAHGDFVRRGWDDATVDALDAWASLALARRRAAFGEQAFAETMRAAPLWHALLPAGVAGPEPLRLVLAPSIDRVGRLFLLALGTAGAAAWTAPPATDALEALAYAAIAGEIDADGLMAALAAAPAGSALPEGGWWANVLDSRAPDWPAGPLDAALLERMLRPTAAIAEVPA